MNYSKESLKLHRKHKGKISLSLKVPLKTKDDLSLAYTPGVAAVSSVIAKDLKQSWQLTNRSNMVAVVSDGSAVLGLGNIGPEGAMPVMEGKAAIFKAFADVDAVPLCINTQDTEEIIKFCHQIAPSFGGINLEDISAPRCFEILERLEKELSIPVFHDDQDGTAIVVLAALINAGKVINKDVKKLKIVINGSGAAGMAITKLCLAYGIKDIIMCDSQGAIYDGRANLNKYKKVIAKKTNKKKHKGNLAEVIKNTDVFIGVSVAGVLTKDMIKSMNTGPIVLAMANPNPEIMPKDAYSAGAFVVGTGRSDFPNQVNNALVFPGLFRGLLDGRKLKITTNMKLAAAEALAKVVKKPVKNEIVPKVTNPQAAQMITKAIIKAS